jgi:hypothetical protein
MAGVTNRGKYLIHRVFFQNQNVPTNLYMALCTSATTPTADTNTLSELTEIAAGNGYTAGGYQLSRNTTDFDVIAEQDSLDRAYIQIKDIVWTASGGPIPASGGGARWAVLTDDSSDPQVIAYFDLGSDRTVSDGQTLTLQNCEIRLTE